MTSGPWALRFREFVTKNETPRRIAIDPMATVSSRRGEFHPRTRACSTFGKDAPIPASPDDPAPLSPDAYCRSFFGRDCRGSSDRYFCDFKTDDFARRGHRDFSPAAGRRWLVIACTFSYFKFTSVILSSGAAWFHCSLTCSKISRKGLPSPGARGATTRSTVSGYGPLVRRSLIGTSSICAT